jgi:hypothetical protein
MFFMFTGQDLDERKSFHASMASLGPPGSQFGGVPPMLHNGGGRFVLGENGAPGRLPTRREAALAAANSKKSSPLPPKEEKVLACCSGHFVVLWIILGIVTFGVLLGIVLKFTVST